MQHSCLAGLVEPPAAPELPIKVHQESSVKITFEIPPSLVFVILFSRRVPLP